MQWAERAQGGLNVCRKTGSLSSVHIEAEGDGWMGSLEPCNSHGLLDFLFHLSVHFDLLIAAGML